MKTRDIYGGNFLAAEDLHGKEVPVTIEGVTIKEFDGKKKAVLSFTGKDKTLAVNVTNANMLEELTGSDDTDDWIGHTVALYPVKVDFQGKRVLAIRVKAARKNSGKALPISEPEPEPEDLTDDDIPF